jgi:ribonuclease HII
MGEPMYLIGADENGMGPRLGPLVVTAVLARVTPEAEKIACRKPRGALAKRLGDSKGLVAHGNIALAEAWSRVLVDRGAGRHRRGGTPDEVLDALTLDERADLTRPCPSHVEAQCWRTDGEAFASADEMGDTMSLVARDLGRLERRGLEVLAVRSVLACTRRLNEAVARGESRFVVDLHAMERLILELHQQAQAHTSGAEVRAVCGKVGGFGEYGKVFGPLAGRLHVVLQEGRARSAYHFPGLGEIAFVRDGDASNMLVGLASLVGKYVRELTMARIVHHYRQSDPDLPVVSGYHDPVTGRFVVSTERLRRNKRVPGVCFVRERLDPPRSAGPKSKGSKRPASNSRKAKHESESLF